MIIPVGTIVTVEAPGSRASDGEVQTIPAIVLKQYEYAPRQPVDLYAFHFEGVPSLMRAVPSDIVKVVTQPIIPPSVPMKFELASDPH